MRGARWRAGRGLLGLLVAAVATAPIGCGLGDSDDDWVALVDGTRIELAELWEAVEPRFEDEPKAKREEIALEELDRLVNEAVILNRAREQDIKVSDEEVDARMKALLGSENGSDASYRETVRRQMILDRTAIVDLAGQVQISESALYHHFEANRERYAEPPRVRIRQIVVEDESRARQILSELRGGADFAMLARAHSLSPDAADGGALDPFAKGDMPEVFERAFELKPGKLSGVIESPYGFHIFQLEERIPEQPAEFESARERIRSELEQARLVELRRGWLRELRRTARIRVNEAALETVR
jgi:parvulin-like peptidyl-prolyl isomerase